MVNHDWFTMSVYSALVLAQKKRLVIGANQSKANWDWSEPQVQKKLQSRRTKSFKKCVIVKGVFLFVPPVERLTIFTFNHSQSAKPETSCCPAVKI